MRIRAVVFGFLGLGWCLFMGFGWGSLPALGPLFEVRNGIWQHESARLETQVLPGLKQEVLLTWDKFGVPHFFAESNADLFYAQGFVMASQRLFQLDINTRQTAGRLSEFYGKQALVYDQFFVRFGLREAAEKTWAKYRQDPETAQMIESYVAGINAWIAQMKDLPPEYKILNVKPKHFEPVDVLNMGKALTWSLSGRSFEPRMTRYLQKLGAEKVLDLFPEFVPDKYEDFILFSRPGRPHPPETAALFDFVSQLKQVPNFPLPNPGRGSNNWAVGPQKSASGTSMLANDTHLNLTLPNTWYENQLSTPAFNVYGTALAAIPGVVNGFNKDIAWGPTNGTTDVLDFFEIEFENETSLRYKWNGDWAEATEKTEKIGVKNGFPETVKVVDSHLGKMVHREGRLGLVADWTGYRPGQELKALRTQWSAKSASECLKGFENWWSPIQNFVCADAKNIGIRHSGFVPKRAPGDGRFFRDGRKSTIDNPGTLTTSVSEVPQIYNPKENYILSANQKVLPPGHPDYLGWDYEPPYRGKMIRRALTAKDVLNSQDMIDLQKENLDLHAESVLPILLRHVDEAGRPGVAGLRRWDHRIRFGEAEGAVTKAWWYALKARLFDDDLGEEAHKLYPKDPRVLWMLERVEKDPQDPDAKWVDDVTTTATTETLKEQINKAYDDAIERLEREQGADHSRWSWKFWNQTKFRHAGRLPGFGSDILEMNGSTDTVRGQGGEHGAVYKAVVVLGDWPKAWIQIPGGNDGDPFSKDFARFLPEWIKGEMRPVEFYRDREEAKANAARFIFLKPSGDS